MEIHITHEGNLLAELAITPDGQVHVVGCASAGPAAAQAAEVASAQYVWGGSGGERPPAQYVWGSNPELRGPSAQYVWGGKAAGAPPTAQYVWGAKAAGAPPSAQFVWGATNSYPGARGAAHVAVDHPGACPPQAPKATGIAVTDGLLRDQPGRTD